MIKNVKITYGITCGITYGVCDYFVEYTNFKDDLIGCKCLRCNKKYQQKFDEKLKKRFFNINKFITIITISLFYCCEKVFIFMNVWMIGKNLMKH